MNTREAWEKYCAEELRILSPILRDYGFSLEQNQPHIQGERYLMQAVTSHSGKKLILVGTRIADGRKVIIKATKDSGGIQELTHERTCREILSRIGFAYKTFFSPEEILFTTCKGYLLSIHAFIPQEKPFLERPLAEQFSLSLQAFKAQESAHATTHAHIRLVRTHFTTANAAYYRASFCDFTSALTHAHPEDTHLKALLSDCEERLRNGERIIEQYCGFLTHIDFVPHNFRIVDDTIYLLDHSSLRFGNKYEGWARFLNFMVLYNKPLEEALVQYVKDNRTKEESESLHLMRIYRLGEIIWYYTRTLSRSEGNLHALNSARVAFWKQILSYTLTQEPIPEDVIEHYKAVRDSLRSEDEKRRQIGLH